MIKLTIDDQRITTPVGRTVLEAAREAGIHIPTLCYHEALEPYGGCRLCVVELETPRGGRLVASCTWPCEPGAVFHTDSEAVRESRRVAAQLLLARAPHVPFIRDLAASLGVFDTPFELPQDACVLCARCVRACRELVGIAAISMTHRGSERTVAPPFRVASASCIECATCVLVCPTGAITLDDITDRARSAHSWPTEYIRHACRLCETHGEEWLPGDGEADPEAARAH